jgi:hypothetical protein
MELEQSLVEWIQSHHVMSSKDYNWNETNQKCILNDAISSNFGNGSLFLLLLKNVIEKYPNIFKGKFVPTLEWLKTANTPAARLFNWNHIGEVLKKTEIVFDVDVKNLIVAGDIEIIGDLLNQLKNLCDHEEARNRIYNSKEKPFEVKSPNMKSISVTFHLEG